MLWHWIGTYLCIPKLQRAPGASLLPPTPLYTIYAFPELRPALPARSSVYPLLCIPSWTFECFRPLIPSLQFLELSDLVYRRCNYTREPPVNSRVPPFPPQCRILLRAQFRFASPPECAARIRGLSKSRRSSRGLVRLRLRSSEVRASVRDRTRSISFQSNPAIPGTAARVRALSEAGPKSLGFSWTFLQSSAFRENLRNTLRRFTPPRTCCWLGECVGFVLGDSSPTDRLPSSSARPICLTPGSYT